MDRTKRASAGARRLGALALVLALGPGCASDLFLPIHWNYFALPRGDDPWMRKIGQWQERDRFERGDAGAAGPAAVAGASDGPADSERPERNLRADYDSFRAAQRRTLARDLARWIQTQSQDHYVPDGPIDRWATLAETLAGNGDDCDGLELLVYRMLREFGFGADSVYRAIVVRPSDGQHHMVTLWFEDKDDPWVIDPTGAMTTGMPHMSEVPGWEPLKVFSEDERFTVERVPLAQLSK
jgi:hypothetical protein